MLSIALPKGRLGSDVYSLFENIGYGVAGIDDDTRKLVFENAELGVRYLLVKPSDVAIYVEHGAADLGIVGRDTLLETKPDVYELLDLGLGACGICTAAPKGYVENESIPLRVATKYTNITREYFSKKNRIVEIIKLNGSVELAPILGLSDIIVDIVETGSTLRENNLEVRTVLTDSTARLIANKSSYKFETAAMDSICGKLERFLKEGAK